jgi:peptide-methionine (S)-S-oxide reductase
MNVSSRIGSALASAALLLLVLVPTARAARAPSTATSGPRLEEATFAGGCFWCEEATFEGLEGVISVTSGYTGGHTVNPTYEEVGTGRTGHAESVRILFDPRKTSYARLLDVFWHNVDPTQSGGQFCDIGNEYRSAIFYHDETQHRLAEQSKRRLESTKFHRPIATEIVPAGPFYPAEGYHQDFYRKNPEEYHSYRTGCGRDKRLAEIWGARPHGQH